MKTISLKDTALKRELNYDSFRALTASLMQTSDNLEVSMFVFGFMLERRDKDNRLSLSGNIELPLWSKWRDQWDDDTWNKVWRGSKNVLLTDEEEREIFPVTGILFLLRQLERIIELQHPLWSFFFVTGSALARFNNNEIGEGEFQYFLYQLPVDFIEKNKEEIMRLCNHFAEKDKTMHFLVQDGRTVFYFLNNDSITSE